MPYVKMVQLQAKLYICKVHYLIQIYFIYMYKTVKLRQLIKEINDNKST